jgi:hypothetical protein
LRSDWGVPPASGDFSRFRSWNLGRCRTIKQHIAT